jgi:hypothetical protein
MSLYRNHDGGSLITRVVAGSRSDVRRARPQTAVRTIETLVLILLLSLPSEKLEHALAR